MSSNGMTVAVRTSATSDLPTRPQLMRCQPGVPCWWCSGVVVVDVGSLNGTYVNRDRIDEVLLSNGDEVQVGKYRLVYYASQYGFGGGPR